MSFAKMLSYKKILFLKMWCLIGFKLKEQSDNMGFKFLSMAYKL